ncbi:DUF3822 family protein [Nonlabens sp.]|uniref:DUF3822 family protein n=1 Tax=Nonlabens sp. TaxID=1888209 RepID=UPI003F6A4B2F
MSEELKKMSVLIHQDGLSFYIYSSSGVQDLISKSFKHESNPIEILREIETAYQNEELLNQLFEQVSLIYHHPIFTGVPVSIYHEDHESDYLKYNTRILETDIISNDDAVQSLDYKTIYIAYSNINNYFFDKYGDFDYYHYTTLALKQHISLAQKNNSIIILDLKESHFYISIFVNGNLRLHNCYPQQAIEDILYYTLFTAQHNQLDPETMELKILANTKEKTLYDLLYTYVRQVSYVTDATSYLEKILCV